VELQVPVDMQERTPLFVMATAGMRLMDADVADAILDACRNTLERGKFLFSRDWVSIIPGYKVTPPREYIVIINVALMVLVGSFYFPNTVILKTPPIISYSK
jgi:Golgi nucleoside diphosphatase